MANTNVPSKPIIVSMEGEEIRISWAAHVRTGHIWNVYADIIGTPPLANPPLNAAPIGEMSFRFSLTDVVGNSPPTHDLWVAITSVHGVTGQESAQGVPLAINVDSGDPAKPNHVTVGRAPSGSPTYLATDQDGVLKTSTALAPPAGGFATETTLATKASEATLAAADTKLGSINGKLPAAVASEATLATLATEATAATLGTEATLATRASEATLAAADTKLGTLVTQTADVATETTLATRATEATLSTRASEVTLATRATEATLATRASEATLAAADTKLGTVAGDTTSLDAKVPAQGQALMAASLPVVIASNQSPVSVKDLLTGANAPTAIPVGATNVALPTTPLVGRKLVVLYNAGNTPVLLGIGGTNVFPLAAGQPLSVSASNAVAFTGQRPTGSGNVIVWEFS